MRFAQLFLGMTLVLAAVPVRAQEPNSRPWWNPLGIGIGNSEPQRTTAAPAPKTSRFFSSSEGTKPLFSLPKLPWQRNQTAASADTPPKSPSVFKRMGDTTKGIWHSTVDLLNPFDNQKDPPEKSMFDHQGYQPQLERETKKKRGWLSWWRPETPPEPTSVNEFLSLPRPGF